MLNKNILWLGAGGAIAVSVAIAITVNLNTNSTINNPTSLLEQTTCSELQQEINALKNTGYDDLSTSIITNIERIKNQDDCYLQGKDWSLINGKVVTQAELQQTIGKETEVDTTKGIDPGHLKF